MKKYPEMNHSNLSLKPNAQKMRNNMAKRYQISILDFRRRRIEICYSSVSF